MKKLLAFAVLPVALGAFAATNQEFQSVAYYLSGKDAISSTQNNQPDGPVSRKEVMDVALAIAGIDRNSTCRGYFMDIDSSNVEVCRTVETAAEHGLINNTATMTRPYDNATNAEAVAILMKAVPDDGAYAGYSYYWDANFPTDGDNIGYKNAYSFAAEWQARTMYDYIRKIKQDDSALKVNPMVSKDSTRAQIYGFAKTVLEYRDRMYPDGIDTNN